MNKSRCSWANPNNPLYLEYHDQEWGRPSHNDGHLFEMLILEGAQAGLSWETVLNKREGYRAVFRDFDPFYMSQLKPKDINQILKNPGIIRHRLKVESAVVNAQAYLTLLNQKGSLSEFLWSFVIQPPVKTRLSDIHQYPTQTPQSQAMSKALKELGFRFVGPTIIYAFMQAVGMVDDHTSYCYLGKK